MRFNSFKSQFQMINQNISLYSLTIVCLFAVQIVKAAGEQPLSSSRIFGGNEVDISDAKFVVQVIIEKPIKNYFCGGSLVTPHHVITAAHCIRHIKPSHITVIGGATYLDMYGARRVVRNVFIHDNPLQNIAVLKLSAALEGSNIQPIQLCDTEWTDGDFMKVYGWGIPIEDDESKSYSCDFIQDCLPERHLHAVEIPILSYEKCSKYFKVKQLPDYFICGGVPGKRDISSGDEGGPAVINNSLCGVVSYQFDSPNISLYTNINLAKTFIKESIHNNKDF